MLIIFLLMNQKKRPKNKMQRTYRRLATFVSILRVLMHGLYARLYAISITHILSLEFRVQVGK